MRIHLLWTILLLALRPSLHAAEPIQFTDANIPIYTLIGEAANQGEKGMIAVAEVIRNRAKKFHHTPAYVCLEKKQFSFWNDGKRARSFLAKNAASIPAARRAWEKSAGTEFTRGATHYDSKDFAPPDWAAFATLTAEIGKHRFYSMN